MFSNFDVACEMWVGAGPLESYKSIISKENFVSLPTVTLNISLLYLHSGTNSRMTPQAIDIKTSYITASFEK